jgi:hypothetical protein
MIYDDDFFEVENLYQDVLYETSDIVNTTSKIKKKRGRRKKSENFSTVEEPKNKIYFGKETHNAIFDYLNCSDIEFKKQIYLTKIFPSFEKLVENLINIHKFASIEESFEELKSDCISFLFENMYKFDFSRGTNAFSYFNVLAKHWLIIKSKQRIQRAKISVSFDSEYMAESSDDDKNTDSPLIVSSPENKSKIEIDNDKNDIMQLLFIIKEMVKSKNEFNCINSIISIFQNVENIDLLNKNAVFLYLREISGLSPKQLTLTIQTIKKYYKKAKIEQVKKNEIHSR